MNNYVAQYLVISISLKFHAPINRKEKDFIGNPKKVSKVSSILKGLVPRNLNIVEITSVCLGSSSMLLYYFKLVLKGSLKESEGK